MAAELLMHGDPLPNLRDREGSGSQIPPPFGHSRLPIPSLRVHLHLLDVPGARHLPPLRRADGGVDPARGDEHSERGL